MQTYASLLSKEMQAVSHTF